MNLLFEIPLYRKSSSDYDKETARLRAKAIDANEVYRNWGEEFGTAFWKSLTADQQAQVTSHWQAYFDGSSDNLPWRYNDICGYLLLASFHDEICAFYWRVPLLRLHRPPSPKVFRHEGRVFSVRPSGSESNIEIAHRIRDAILAWRKGHLPSRHVDLDVFGTIAQFVDWKAALASSTS